jgi:nicotinamidase/pyrazinamidase
MTTVFVDVDTQLDFMLPTGALYVPQAETIVGTIAGLNRWAAKHGGVVLSTMDAHSENDPEFSQWPPHCVAGTLGQRKLGMTLLDRRAVVPSTPGEFAVVTGAQQVIVEKQNVDCFTNANLERVLEHLAADRYVVYGVVTEVCVKLAAMGLLRTGRRVELVEDAVKSLRDSDSDATIAAFVKAGGVLTRSGAVLNGS